MDIKEFKTAERYRLFLKDEKQARDDKSKAKIFADTLLKSSKTEAFYSFVPLIIDKNPLAMYRDFIDLDYTFSLVVPSSSDFKFLEVLDTFLNTVDVLEESTYLKVKNHGFVRLGSEEKYEGFWILLDGRH
jgi:hypothetical protein